VRPHELPYMQEPGVGGEGRIVGGYVDPRTLGGSIHLEGASFLGPWVRFATAILPGKEASFVISGRRFVPAVRAYARITV